MMTDVKRLEVPEPLVRLAKAFRGEGYELYLVGGYVRDTLLGRTKADAHRKPDAATDAHPGEIKRILRPHAEHLWAIGERFGTIVAKVEDYEIDVTTYRSDLYTEGSRHPQVSFGESLEEDLARRDFTINAIAADALTGRVIDPFNGRKDLASGVIRTVGEPLDRMRDDPLRILRAVRFETTLSKPDRPFATTLDLEGAIRGNAHWLESISAKRIRDEFEKILLSENVAHGLRALVRLGLMPYVVPEFMETVNVEQESEFHHKDVFEHTLIVVESIDPEDPDLREGEFSVLRKAAFFHDIGKPRTLVYEHRCTYCGAKSTQKTPEDGDCEVCGGPADPPQH